MKKVLLLTRFVKEYEPRRIAQEAREMGLEIDLVKYGQIELGVVDGKVVLDLGKGRKIEDYDFIIPRAASKEGSSMVSTKMVVLEMANKLGIKTLNGESFAKYPLLGKIEQGVMLVAANLQAVDFISFGSKKGWREFRTEPKFNFPMIVKGRFGSHGRKVRLVNDWQQFERIFSEYSEGSVLVQPKLRVRQWYRCLVVGGEYLGEMRHRQRDKYGGEGGRLVGFNSTKMGRLKVLCLMATRLFECDFAGLDVAWDEDREDWVILEVNRTAQFKYFERRTGENVAKALVKLFE